MLIARFISSEIGYFQEEVSTKGRERQMFYFNKPGFVNTDEVVEIVYKWLRSYGVKH